MGNRSSRATRNRPPEVVNNLGSMVENQLGNRIHRQYWYDGIPDTGPHRYQRALRTCDGVQLRTGQLIEWGERRTQKAVDTRLVADMILAAMKQQVTDFVLVSGDADMIPGRTRSRKRGRARAPLRLWLGLHVLRTAPRL